MIRRTRIRWYHNVCVPLVRHHGLFAEQFVCFDPVLSRREHKKKPFVTERERGVRQDHHDWDEDRLSHSDTTFDIR